MFAKPAIAPDSDFPHRLGARLKTTAQTYPMKKLTPLDRFVAKTKKISNGCIIWMASPCEIYGRFWDKDRWGLAHRFSFESFIGPIPDGLTLDHLCRNPRCVNPLHLEPVTNRVNILRGTSFVAIHARKTHCIRGHALTEDNVYHARNGGRYCRKCRPVRRAERKVTQ